MKQGIKKFKMFGLALICAFVLPITFGFTNKTLLANEVDAVNVSSEGEATNTEKTELITVINYLNDDSSEPVKSVQFDGFVKPTAIADISAYAIDTNRSFFGNKDASEEVTISLKNAIQQFEDANKVSGLAGLDRIVYAYDKVKLDGVIGIAQSIFEGTYEESDVPIGNSGTLVLTYYLCPNEDSTKEFNTEINYSDSDMISEVGLLKASQIPNVDLYSLSLKQSILKATYAEVETQNDDIESINFTTLEDIINGFEAEGVDTGLAGLEQVDSVEAYARVDAVLEMYQDILNNDAVSNGTYTMSYKLFRHKAISTITNYSDKGEVVLDSFVLPSTIENVSDYTIDLETSTMTTKNGIELTLKQVIENYATAKQVTNLAGLDYVDNAVDLADLDAVVQSLVNSINNVNVTDQGPYTFTYTLIKMETPISTKSFITTVDYSDIEGETNHQEEGLQHIADIKNCTEYVLDLNASTFVVGDEEKTLKEIVKTFEDKGIDTQLSDIDMLEVKHYDQFRLHVKKLVTIYESQRSIAPTEHTLNYVLVKNESTTTEPIVVDPSAEQPTLVVSVVVDGPETGDTTNPWLFVSALVAAGGLLMILAKRKTSYKA
ncbi:hypothetical protein A4S06_02705 [Erysipelotrichaceae bacterium MTC7]|nr:hypothetical protein A4S06_02705 [Erysipelotrichaceae bacterium MTC7]